MDEDGLTRLLQRYAQIPSVTEEGQAVAEQLAGLTFAINGLLLFSCDLNARVLAACVLPYLIRAPPTPCCRSWSRAYIPQTKHIGSTPPMLAGLWARSPHQPPRT